MKTLAAAALPLLLAGGATGLAAQEDSVTVTASARYRASGLKARVLGDDYRDLWTTPVRLPVLDPRRYAGGLTPVERGGGKQTVSLRLRGADGREYVFRSVDKDQTGGLPEDFQETEVDEIAQDQVSSKHPASALIVAPLLRAAGVLHATPRLVVMPDDPFLGEFRREFGGMLGLIEERPEDVEDGNSVTFAGAERIAGTPRLLEHLEDDPENRVSARAYLRARLMDLLIGDWDRHADQWRWARYDSAGVRLWHPIPRDRDNALSQYDGLMMNAVRQGAPMLVEFGPRYPDVFGLMALSQVLDRRILAELPRAVFDSMAVALQGRITDAVIEQAVASAPPEYHARRGAEIATSLRSRRDALRDYAGRFYTQVATDLEVRATDRPEMARVDRLPDGSVEVSLYEVEDGRPAARPYFQRRALYGETREVRLFLQGENDHAVVRGTAPHSVRVRVIGGGGDDLLADSSSVGGIGQRTAFHDDRGNNRIEPGGEASVDTRAWEPPVIPGTGFNDNRPALREWGSQLSWFQPWAEWRYNVGPVVGGGPTYIRYGFRQVPYAYRLQGRFLYAPLDTRFGVELDGDFRRVGTPSRLRVLASASQLETVRFHGFGNAAANEGSSTRFKIPQTEYRLEPTYHHSLRGERLFLFGGPVVRYTSPDLPAGNPALAGRPFGSEAFGQAGAQVGALLDTRDAPMYPRNGVVARLSTAAFPTAWDVREAFGSAGAEASGYLPLPLPLETTLALRAGAERAWGDFPFQQAVLVGGRETLRGFPRQRFAGDTGVYGGIEARAFLTRFNFISKGDLGALVLTDAGRVWMDGDSPGGWHTSVGAGVWVGILERTRTFSVVLARGEETAVYFSLGMPF